MGNFDWWIAEDHVSSNLINEYEKKWVATLDCVYPKGYNRTTGGIGNFKASKETCEKIKQSQLGKKEHHLLKNTKLN